MSARTTRHTAPGPNSEAMEANASDRIALVGRSGWNTSGPATLSTFSPPTVDNALSAVAEGKARNTGGEAASSARY